MPQPTIPRLLEELIAGEGAKARVTVARGVLEDQLLSIYQTTGSAPTLRLPLGTVSLSVPKPHPEITDPDAFASWVAQRHPSEVSTSVTLTGVAADALPVLIEALEGLRSTWPDLKVEGHVTVREAFRSTVLDGAVGDRDTPGAPLFAADTLEQIDGLEIVEPHGSPTMSVRLEKEAKARAIVTARAAAENDLAAGMPPASPDAEAAGAAAAVRLVTVVEGLPGYTTESGGSPADVDAPVPDHRTTAERLEQADVDDDVEPDREPAAPIGGKGKTQASIDAALPATATAVEDPCGTPTADGETCAHAKDAHGGAKHNGACRACANGGSPTPCSRYRKARNTRTATRVPATTGA